MSIDKNYAGINATYIRSLLLSAGFSNTDLPPKPLVLVQKLEDYLQSYDWTVDWYDSIDLTKLNDKLLSLYDELSDVRDMKIEDVAPEEDMMITLGLQLGVTEAVAECEADTVLIKFSEFYALSIYYHVLKNTTADVWANGNEHEEYASQYSKALLSHYGYDDEYLTDTTLEKNFNKVVRQLVYDPYDLWVIAHMTSKVVQDYHAQYQEYLWTNYKSNILNNWAKYAPIPSPNSQYIIAYDVKVVEPPVLIHDVKLDDVELPVIVPQEVVSEPQEELSLSTTIEDKTMSIILPDFSTNGNTFTLVPVDFTSIWYEVPTVEPTVEPVVEPVVECDLDNEFTQWDVVRTGKPYFPEVLEFTALPSKPVEPTSTQPEPKEEYVNHTNWRGKRQFIPQWRPELRPTEEIKTSARIEQLVREAEAKAELQSPTTTTNSEVAVSSAVEAEVAPDKPVTVSDEQFAELEKMFDKAMGSKPKHTFTVVNRKSFQGNQIDPDCSRPIASATGSDHQYSNQVSEFKSTLFNVDEYDITRNVVVDVATTTPKATPKATPATPKATPVSTAKFGTNFNSLVMAKYRELNNGIIKDSLILNKLTSALRSNNIKAYTALVNTFGNATAVSLHRQAYDAVVSAS